MVNLTEYNDQGDLQIEPFLLRRLGQCGVHLMHVLL